MATTPGIGTAQVLNAALDAAHQTLEATMAGVDDELANRAVAGQANRLGAAYAHAVLAEDAVVHAMFQGQTPLFAGAWAGKTGTDRPVVISSAPFAGAAPGDLGEWYRTVQVDVDACRAYAQAVQAAATAFIGGADDATLTRRVDLSFIGMGVLPLAVVCEIFVTAHLNNLAGEISAIKGTFGLQGYPF
jgi:hypothetical protein